MFYEPGKTDHGLPHDPFKVSPPAMHHLDDATTTPTIERIILASNHNLSISVFSGFAARADESIHGGQACVVPRPIGWISTISPKHIANGEGSNGSVVAEGTANLAPFSQFNNLTFDPPCKLSDSCLSTQPEGIIHAPLNLSKTHPPKRHLC
jgi:hypothetical protein